MEQTRAIWKLNYLLQGEICDNYIQNQHIQMLGRCRVPASAPKRGGNHFVLSSSL